MRKLLVPFGVVVYFAVYFVDAESLHAAANDGDVVDDSFENDRHGKRQPVEPKLTEPDDEPDARVTTDRGVQSSEVKNNTDDKHEEFKNDLKNIKNFAQNVRPIATNMRRSLHAHQTLSLDFQSVIKYVKETLLGVIDSSDKYIPYLIPLTKILRKFIMKLFSN